MNFIVKKRAFLGMVARAFGGYVGSYSPWTTVTKAPTREAALAAVVKRDGLTQYALFQGGKRIEWIVR